MAGFKVLIVNHAVEMGGAERVLLRFLDTLDRGLFEPALACPHRGPLVEAAEERGLKVHLGYPVPRLLEIRRKSLGGSPLSRLAYPYDMARTVTALARLVRDEGYDLVLTNSAKADIYGSLAGRLAARPVVWRLHDIVDYDAFSVLNVLLFTTFAGLFAARVLAVSGAARDALTARGVRASKVAVVHNGIDVRRLASSYRRSLSREKLAEEFGIAPEAPLAGLVGRLVDWKGPDRFIAAAAGVARELPAARFLLVGDAIFGEASYVDELRAQTRRLGLEERVVFTGFREDALEITAGLDVLVHASLLPDPLPTVLIEAMAMGVPVVAADAGGVREIVEDGVTGRLVPPGEVEDMARAMIALLSDSGTATAMGERGRERALRLFEIERQCRLFEEELLSVLRERGRRG
ncbi:MAG: glycosyltransferase [Actinobacteria bacterium]|nr:glycosyltransferase [Actinomycetota bacterium]MDI6831183.1 glycosyltransferase [Actinomycetota bacterium]